MSTTATETKDYSEYTGKSVIVTQNLEKPDADGNGTVEVEGKVQVANALGILLKPKGQINVKMIEAGEIEEIRLAPEKASKLKRSKLQVVKLGQARRHLLTNHGVQLAWANSVTEEQAFEYHQGLNHEELDLGHVHVEKEEQTEGETAGDES
jgi:filamentous hemagglutinin family protein